MTGSKHILSLLTVSMLFSTLLLTACQVVNEKVCVVLDTANENDASFNQYTLKGAREAAAEAGLEFAHAPSLAESDYLPNIEDFIAEGCDLILTVGFLMSRATAEAAREYPNVDFAIVDVAYLPGAGCTDTVDDCYSAAGGLDNVTSLMFAEDEVGYLAGTLAGCMSETGIIGSVAGIEVPPVVRFVTGYQHGAQNQNPDIETLNVYIPDFDDPATGKRESQGQIRQGADVIFGVGGNTGNGAIQAAHEAGIWAIGVDVDQYFTFSEVGPSLLTSAMKNVDTAAYDAVTAFAKNELAPGILTSTVANGGIGLAPFHEQEDQVPSRCRQAVAEAESGLNEGTIDTGYRP